VNALTISGAAIRNGAGTVPAALSLPSPGGAGSLAQARQLAVDTTGRSKNNYLTDFWSTISS
jgi:hypothetical protein